MNNRYIVSGYVITVSCDGNEFEIFLQKEERDDWTDYDFILKTRGRRAIAMEDIVNIGDEIFISFSENMEV